jgi:hypothetical protein
LLIGLFTAVVATAGIPDPPAITGFKFEVQYNSEKIADDIVTDIYGDSLIIAIIPFQQSDFSLIATFTTAYTETIRVNGVDQQSTVTINDFSSAVVYELTSLEETRTYKVKLVSTGLPLVYVYTDGAAPVLNKEDYVIGTIKIYPNEEAAEIFGGEMEIRGRGNTTWSFPKKPYRVKLGSAASLLGMPSDKDWVLLANYADKTLMRNSLAFHLGSEMNFAYTPRTTPVDVVLNGVYQGNYLLGEHVKADKDRVNIEELGGYFLELDDYRDGIYFELASGLPIVIKSPDEDEMTDEQLNYIKGYMQQAEDVIFSDDFADPVEGYAKFINPETFIEWYWVSEVFKNIDARDVSSIFYYKDRDEKLNMGPLWDFDVAAGNASVNAGDDPTSFYVREAKWFKRLFEDPAFKSAAEARWFTLRNELLANLPGVIDDYAGKLELSQEQNFYKWDILDQPIWPSTQALGSYEEEVAYLKEWLSERIAWIDAQIERPSEPEEPVVAVPVLHSPAANETVEHLNPTMTWFTADLAEQYDVQVSLTDSFETLIVDQAGLVDTTYLIAEPLVEQTTYYWRARSVKASQQSDWSETRSFITPLISGIGDVMYGVSMFPNPTTHELYIDVASLALIENAELVDVLGRTAVSSKLLAGGRTKIDVSNLERGLYMVILRAKIGKPVTTKVMLK